MKSNVTIASFLRNPVIDEKKKKEVIAKISREARSPAERSKLAIRSDCAGTGRNPHGHG